MDSIRKQLHEISNLEEGKRRNLLNYDNPDKCDFCGKSLKEETFFIDGALRGSIAWAYMCPDCFSQRAQGLGWGKGQLYMKQPSGEWVMTAGFPPEENFEL